MYTKRIMLFCVGCLFIVMANSQDTINEQDADTRSLQLYNEQKWNELLQFGKSTIASGVEFPLLRMRTGYAAFVLGNYSESLKHYGKVYEKDPQNFIALHYVYLSNLYLNNVTAARYYATKMPVETVTSEKIKKYKLSSLALEYSYKSPDINLRENAQYGRLGLNMQLGYRLELQQSVSFYNQVISEPKLFGVTNNNSIDIAQREYYGKFIFAAGGKWSVIGGIHYLFIPFNNFKYNNLVGFGGVKYASPYIHLQAMANFAGIRDSSFTQFDAVMTAYPTGNNNFYTISRASYGNDFTFTQVAGVKILKKAWLEANVTAGSYNILLANDALYVFDDIDVKKLRIGGSLYILVSKNLMLSANYTFDKKERFASPTTYFHQHSTTGGLTWNF